MKNITKFIGIITLAAVIGFTMTACGGSGGGGASSAPLGATLNLTGQVYTVEWDDNDNLVFERFEGNRSPVTWWNQGVTGAINAGILNFSVGTPPNLTDIIDFFYYDIEELNNFTISDTSAEIARLSWLDTPNGEIGRWNESVSESRGRTTWTWEFVSFFYVDRNVNIRANRTTWVNDECEDDLWPGDCWCRDCTGETWTETINAFNINFYAGWNALFFSEVGAETANGGSFTATISAGNPARLRWVLDEWGGFSQAAGNLSAYGDTAVQERQLGRGFARRLTRP